MNYRAAVKAFFDGGGQLQLGVGASLAAGPYGRAADVSASASNTNYIAATYAYSASKGLYIGYSFEGSKISERVNTNQAYYGRPITAREILTGVVPPTQDAAKLYDMLTAMGAGPRPGLPFAPKNAKGQPLSPTASSMSSPQSNFQRPLPPLQQQGPSRTSNNQRPNTNEQYEDPPPPYQAYDSSKAPPHPPTSSSMNNGNPNSPYTSPQQQQNNSVIPPPINDSKRPIVNNDGKSNYNNVDQNQFSRQNINQAAVNIHNTGNAQGFGPGSSDNNNFSTGPSNSFSATGPTSNNNNNNNNNHFTGPSSSSTSPPMNATTAPGTTMALSGPPQSSTDVKKPIMDEPRTNSLTVVVAKYDYTGDQPTDLSFQAGDHIIVTKRLDDRQSWWEGEIGDRRGFFPANYTDELME